MPALGVSVSTARPSPPRISNTSIPRRNIRIGCSSWGNFLLGCKNCNNAKVAHFPLDTDGNHLLIDPCADEPLDYFVWDLQSGATGLAPTPRYSRAFATRQMFHLDEEPLPRNAALNLESCFICWPGHQ